MSARALRRHHRARTRRAAAAKLRARGMSEAAVQRLALRLADNLRACSCAGCARPTWLRGSDERAAVSAAEQLCDV